MTIAHGAGDDTFGLPYAAPVSDAEGYAVLCPICGARCAAEGTLGEATLEDDATKGALRAYQLHFEQAERAERSADL